MLSHSPFFIGFAAYTNLKISDFNFIENKKNQPDSSAAVECRLKIIVCGQDGTGKTSLIYRLKDNKFDPQLSSCNRIHLDKHAMVGNKKTWLRISDIEGTKATFSSEDENVKIKYDAYATFILINCIKSQKNDDIKRFITNKITEVRKSFPDTHIVLVASKSDKKYKTDSEILKTIAQELDCAGAAIVSAKDGSNINSLMACTLEYIRPKPVLINSNSATLQVKSPSSFFQATRIESKTNTTPFVTTGERDIIIQKIDARLNKLSMEAASVLTTDKEIKIYKLLAIKELSVLVHQVPDIPIHRHIEYIRNTYGEKLEYGDPSKTKIMLDDIYKIAKRNVPDEQLNSRSNNTITKTG